MNRMHIRISSIVTLSFLLDQKQNKQRRRRGFKGGWYEKDRS
jgi:hypothetical protein